MHMIKSNNHSSIVGVSKIIGEPKSESGYREIRDPVPVSVAKKVKTGKQEVHIYILIYFFIY